MVKDLNEAQLALAELMGQISEAGYSAGWMEGLEFDLWAILNGEGKKYGHHIITPDEILQLQSLVDNCGCWIVFDDQYEEKAIELDAWKQIYSGRSI